MHHPDDGNLVALERHLKACEEGEREAEILAREVRNVLNYNWDAVIDAIGKDFADVLARVYFGGAEGVASAKDTIHNAAQKVAAKNLGIML